jgi:hypothetical protein
MYKLIIDKDLNNYNPLFNFSVTQNIESISINKYERVYLFIDDLNMFYKFYNDFNKDQVTFIYNKNIKFKVNDLLIEVKSFIIDGNDFREKVIKHNFIKNYLIGGKK